MINFYNQVPSVYTSASRDFQYLSWLINIVLNSVKHNVDDIYDLPNTKADSRLTTLLAMTLGFKVKRNYDQKQLMSLVSIIPRILKYKGTEEAIELVGKALMTSSGAAGSFECELKNNCLEVILPDELVDTTLFMDLLPYILPAGITCRILRYRQTKIQVESTKIGYHDALQAAWYKDLAWDESAQSTTGLAGLFDVGNSDPVFANYKKNEQYDMSINQSEEEKMVLNEGLLDNTIIPVLANPLKSTTEADYLTEPNESGTTVIINKYSTEDNENGTTTVIGGDYNI